MRNLARHTEQPQIRAAPAIDGAATDARAALVLCRKRVWQVGIGIPEVFPLYARDTSLSRLGQRRRARSPFREGRDLKKIEDIGITTRFVQNHALSRKREKSAIRNRKYFSPRFGLCGETRANFWYGFSVNHVWGRSPHPRRAYLAVTSPSSRQKTLVAIIVMELC